MLGNSLDQFSGNASQAEGDGRECMNCCHGVCSALLFQLEILQDRPSNPSFISKGKVWGSDFRLVLDNSLICFWVGGWGFEMFPRTKRLIMMKELTI
jgi:hypothetical protein